MKKSLITLAIAAVTSLPAYASTSIAGGIWMNHGLTTQATNSTAPDRDAKTLGTSNYEALILYIDHQQETSNWQLSAEWRAGSGSFSDSANNSSGDSTSFHKLWVGYNFSADRKVLIGKSRVPFGWKTSNFWGGDMALGGYADQMDVGVKFSDKQGAINYDLAWYVSDDFGATSTDTMDDNGHWGSSNTYRKVNTAVANVGYEVMPGSTIGASYQQGDLQDLSAAVADDKSTFGSHKAWNLWYKGKYGNVTTMAQVLGTQRNDLDKIGVGTVDEVKTLRHALSLAYAAGPFKYYIEYTGASTDTKGNKASDMVAFTPGVSYNYGKGWIYAEYLTSINNIGAHGDVVDTGNASNDDNRFSAMYLTIDYYF